MKGLLRVLLVLSAFVLAVPAWASDRSVHDKTYINLFGGNTFFDGSSGLGHGGNAGVVGLRMGRRVETHVGVEAQVAAAFAHLQNPLHSNGGDANQYSGAVIGNLYAFGSPNTPYLSLGLGASSNLFNDQLGQGTSLMGILGVGYQYLLNDHVGLRLDVQDQLLFNAPTPSAANINGVQVTGGISYFWGGGHKSSFPVVDPAHP
ncbi:flagellar motor protein MotB [Acidithiobacillus ferrianus]|uniref:Flagellar motor protein MotB n=2 Tax=Acidithiobacillus ferrianus TaxID=2678518 RepID=A0A845UCY7_9PROT|nr:flagellar motor protein MotB [Acidithiobacillus ferrianus]NDU43215.1 flagellar motor protein MotB [Acidithiobacillus ferrianus]